MYMKNNPIDNTIINVRKFSQLSSEMLSTIDKPLNATIITPDTPKIASIMLEDFIFTTKAVTLFSI